MHDLAPTVLRVWWLAHESAATKTNLMKPTKQKHHATDPSRAPFEGQGEQGKPFDSSRASQGKQGKRDGTPKRQIFPKMGGTEFRAKADPSLVHRSADSLVMATFLD